MQTVPPVPAVRRDFHLWPVAIEVPGPRRPHPAICAGRVEPNSEAFIAARTFARAALRPGGGRVIAAKMDKMVDIAVVVVELYIEACEGLIGGPPQPGIEVATRILAQGRRKLTR